MSVAQARLEPSEIGQVFGKRRISDSDPANAMGVEFGGLLAYLLSGKQGADMTDTQIPAVRQGETDPALDTELTEDASGLKSCSVSLGVSPAGRMLSNSAQPELLPSRLPPINGLLLKMSPSALLLSEPAFELSLPDELPPNAPPLSGPIADVPSNESPPDAACLQGSMDDSDGVPRETTVEFEDPVNLNPVLVPVSTGVETNGRTVESETVAIKTVKACKESHGPSPPEAEVGKPEEHKTVNRTDDNMTTPSPALVGGMYGQNRMFAEPEKTVGTASVTAVPLGKVAEAVGTQRISVVTDTVEPGTLVKDLKKGHFGEKEGDMELKDIGLFREAEGPIQQVTATKNELGSGDTEKRDNASGDKEPRTFRQAMDAVNTDDSMRVSSFSVKIGGQRPWHGGSAGETGAKVQGSDGKLTESQAPTGDSEKEAPIQQGKTIVRNNETIALGEMFAKQKQEPSGTATVAEAPLTTGHRLHVGDIQRHEGHVEMSGIRSGSDSSEMIVKLDQSNLGEIQVRVEVKDGTVKADVQTDSLAARDALLRNLPDLKDSLSSRGINVSSLQVSVDQGDYRGSQHQGYQRRARYSAPVPNKDVAVPAVKGTSQWYIDSVV